MTISRFGVMAGAVGGVGVCEVDLNAPLGARSRRALICPRDEDADAPGEYDIEDDDDDDDEDDYFDDDLTSDDADDAEDDDADDDDDDDGWEDTDEYDDEDDDEDSLWDDDGDAVPCASHPDLTPIGGFAAADIWM